MEARFGGPSRAACVPEVRGAIGTPYKREDTTTRVTDWQRRLHPRYEYYSQTGEVLTKRFKTPVLSSKSDSMRRVSFTCPSIIARHAAVCKFWRKTALAAVNQRIVFEGFPIVIFGDHTLSAYDQTVQVNKEDDLDLVTDVNHLRFAARVQFCGHEKEATTPSVCEKKKNKSRSSTAKSRESPLDQIM